jgi:hypothetical protein
MRCGRRRARSLRRVAGGIPAGGDGSMGRLFLTMREYEALLAAQVEQAARER